MKSVFGPFIAAVVLALAGGAFWMAGHTESRLADVHKQLATLRYADADTEGDEVEQSLGVERRVPVLGPAAENDVRDARASAGYWRSDYAAIAPHHDANGVVTESDPTILFLSANGAFRASQNATDRGDASRRLDNVVKSYGEVLKTQASGCAAGAQACETRAEQASNGLTIGEEDQGGHALDAHLRRRLQVLVGIHAGETQLADVGLAQFLEDGSQRTAGRAPRGREIDEHRQRRL